MTWIDRLWEHEPAEPVIGSRSGLTQTEKRILLAFALGGENAEIAEAIGVKEGVFKRQNLQRLRTKLHAEDPRRLVKVGYEVGALELSQEPPQGVELPQDLLDVLLLIVDGYDNTEIAAKLGRAFGTTRTHVGVLAKGFGAKAGIGSRTQLASRAFEFGIIKGATVSPKQKPKKSS